MVLPSGSLAMTQIANEFAPQRANSAPHSLSEYKGVRFSNGAYAPNGSISFSHFGGKGNYVPPPLPPPPPPSPSPSPPSSCFYEETPINLQNGSVVPIKDLRLGDVLKGGSVVNVTMQIKNIHKKSFYKVFSEDIGDYIYVTGDHHIKEDGMFIHVENSKYATISDKFENVFICLITSNHNIPIGEYTFWDWADTCDACNECTILQEYFERDDRLNGF